MLKNEKRTQLKVQWVREVITKKNANFLVVDCFDEINQVAYEMWVPVAFVKRALNEKEGK